MPGPEMGGQGVHPALSAGGIGEMIQRFRHQGPGTTTVSEANQQGNVVHLQIH